MKNRTNICHENSILHTQFWINTEWTKNSEFPFFWPVRIIFPHDNFGTKSDEKSEIPKYENNALWWCNLRMECYKCLMVCGEKMWASIAKLPFFYTFLAFCNLTNCCILHLTILLRFYTFFFCFLSVVAKGALEILPLFNQLFCSVQKSYRKTSLISRPLC